MNNPDINIKDIVKEKYGEAALRVGIPYVDVAAEIGARSVAFPAVMVRVPCPTAEPMMVRPSYS
jgi:hypothetical protein